MTSRTRCSLISTSSRWPTSIAVKTSRTGPRPSASSSAICHRSAAISSRPVSTTRWPGWRLCTSATALLRRSTGIAASTPTSSTGFRRSASPVMSVPYGKARSCSARSRSSRWTRRSGKPSSQRRSSSIRSRCRRRLRRRRAAFVMLRRGVRWSTSGCVARKASTPA